MGRKHLVPRALELLVGIGGMLSYAYMLVVQRKQPFLLAHRFGFGEGLAEWLRTHPAAEHIVSMFVGLFGGLVIANQISNGPNLLSKAPEDACDASEETRKIEEAQKVLLEKLAKVPYRLGRAHRSVRGGC